MDLTLIRQEDFELPLQHGPAYAMRGTLRFEERRRAHRLRCHCPAIVRGTNRRGERFETRTHVESVSATGLYFSLAQEPAPDAPIFVVFRLSDQPQVASPQVAVRGTVRRIDPDFGLAHGVAVRFARHRFL